MELPPTPKCMVCISILHKMLELCFLLTKAGWSCCSSTFSSNQVPSSKDHQPQGIWSWSQNTVCINNKQSWGFTGPCAHENQPHTNSHHGGRGEQKTFQKQTEEKKAGLRRWLHSDCPCPHECLRDKACGKKCFASLAWETGSNLLNYLQSKDRDPEIWLSGERKWLWIVHKISFLKKEDNFGNFHSICM